MVKKTFAVELRQHSARMRTYVTVLWTISLLLVAGERFSAAAIGAFRSGFANPEMRRLGCQAVAAIPEAFLLLAVWRVRTTLSAFADGEWFAARMPPMLERVALLLVCGAAARVVVVPGFCRLLGFDQGYWIAFDTAALVLGAIGLALRAIAGVLHHASTLQADLDEIF